MQRKRIATTWSLMGMCLLVCMSASNSKGDDTEIKGIITTRTGETLIVKNEDGKHTVVLTAGTRTKDNTGLFGLGREEYSNVVLVPGLKVEVEGSSDQRGQVTARTITVDGDDLETAEMIQSGLHPTVQQVAANMTAIEANARGVEGANQGVASNGRSIETTKRNVAANQQNIAANRESLADHERKIQANIGDIQENTDRFSSLTDFNVKAQETVNFNVGSSTLSKKDQEKLKQLAQNAIGTNGYIIEVMGYADSRGNALMNEKLSEDRAKRVIGFLIQQCNVPVRHIVAPGAMGEYQPVKSNETKQGRAENRRVEIKVLVNRGIAGA